MGGLVDYGKQFSQAGDTAVDLKPSVDILSFVEASVRKLRNRRQLDWNLLCKPQPALGIIAVRCDMHLHKLYALLLKNLGQAKKHG